MKSVMISSNRSGGGKTTVTLGLMKALKNRGYKVQGYKTGPDYIDTAFHSEVTGVPSRNLDLYLMGEDGVKAAFSRGEGDLAVIEGAMGLYDGKGLDEEYSSYSISKALGDIPIVLVLTAEGQSVTLCAEIEGLKNFRNANVVGVILNNISEGYYNLLKPAIEINCGIKVFGYLPREEKIELSNRHLGLVQSIEVDNLFDKIDIIADMMEKYIDLDEILKIFKEVNQYEDLFHMKDKKIKIAVAYDKAFRFYYKENLELLEEIGKVIYFSPLRDEKLPSNIDFLYLGGGYPEVFKEELNKNFSMRNSIREALEDGLRCYGECGGLMYLTEAIDDVPMVGFLNGKSEMTNRLNRFGYATVNYDGISINCHEFHKSKVESNEETVYNVEKFKYNGDKISWNCGYMKKNTLAGYPHVHFFGNIDFLKYIIKGK
ncbi:Cobyrinic acid A,C-diamide synthase [Clostridium bornimense]|uniref:Cobyrinate a,c-diamide synthase n=1 Tax=Clostridium bornimense TaxID=1216932 RepID=W6RVM1_9CLOT|nr:cobyrinate a,c-diamide synthase [Clostridium bornimense]CDM67654.1 Cobyrinic acid A,C-diamide synthase [Clostridium bornimense]